MRVLVITGPSGSGKTYLSNKLSKLFNNSIVIKTDSYYRSCVLIKILSMFIYDIYDRPISIKKNELTKTLKSIQNKQKLIPIHKYEFKRKISSKSKTIINYKDDQLLILEGIFAHRLDLHYQETVNIICEEKKENCFKRRLKRDEKERGRNERDVNQKFNKSWYLFYRNIQDYYNNNEIITVNPVDKDSYDKFIFNLQKNITKENN